MNRITFEMKSLIRISLELSEYPELSSRVKLVQKGIQVLKQKFPSLLKYLSRQQVLSNLNQYHITIKVLGAKHKRRVKRMFKLWLKKEKSKRIACLIIEAIIIPFTGILVPIPGPNFFFYALAVLFYYHLISFLGLKKVNVDQLNLNIIPFD